MVARPVSNPTRQGLTWMVLFHILSCERVCEKSMLIYFKVLYMYLQSYLLILSTRKVHMKESLSIFENLTSTLTYFIFI